MIVFINGSFGIGKTTVAKLLIERLPNCLLFDAEEVGFMLRNIIGEIDPTDDFQHYPMWRTSAIETAKGLRENYRRNLVMPMTIWRVNYFTEVMSGLGLFEPDLYHFCLTASDDVIRQRIRQRGDQPEGDWIYSQVAYCVNAFHSDVFEKRIDTSTKSPEQIAEIIVQSLSGV